MLTILGSRRTVCGGLSRRELLQAGGTGLLGAGLPQLLQAEEAGLVRRPRAKSVLFLFLFGGPSQLESFDPKPDAASGIRGPFGAIQTRTPGLYLSEYLPRLAACSDRYTVVRTMTHDHNDHNACHYILTGRRIPPADNARTDFADHDWPAMGSVVEYLGQRERAARGAGLSDYVFLPNKIGFLQGYDRPGPYGGWLGKAYNPMMTQVRSRAGIARTDDPYFRDCTEEELDFRIQGLAPQPQLTLDRLSARRDLLAQFDAGRAGFDAAAGSNVYPHLKERAFSLITDERVRIALDIRQEPAATRDRYGRHLFGQAALMGRRMIEAGVRFVTVTWDMSRYSWDSHQTCDELRNHLLPGLDQTVPALLTDMQDRGLLDETLVVCMGEMGRNPTPDPQAANWGRGHWCRCFPALLAGAGIRGGATYGRSDKDARWPMDHPVSPEELAATIFDALGIDPHAMLRDPQNRPVPIVNGGRPLRELFG
jgi:hypothetical protein